MIITKEYIMHNRTDNGSWTKSQIEVLGLDWPPEHGWIKSLVGKRITKQQQVIFEAAIPAESVTERYSSVEAILKALGRLGVAELSRLQHRINQLIRQRS